MQANSMFLSRFFLTLSLTFSVTQAGLFPARKLPSSNLAAIRFLRKAADNAGIDLDSTLLDSPKSVIRDEWAVPEWVEGSSRKMLESCDFDSCNLSMLDCGQLMGLVTRNEDNWCLGDGQEICCGEHDECCKLNEGVLAGYLIAILLIVVASIVGCCCCCTCCCLHPSKCRKR